MKFTVHNKNSAPDALKPVFDQVQKAYGFIPNLYGIFANSPVALHTYLSVLDLLDKHAALDAQEQQLVMLAVSAENGCDYCVAAHSAVAKMAQVPDDQIEAVRENRPLGDAKRTVLVRFARKTIEHRGWTPPADIEAFLAAGYTQQHVLDVLAIAAIKTLSNYTNHLANTPIDAAFGGKN